MLKIAIILLAAQDTPEGAGRMANALTTAQEFQEAGDDVRLTFDGAAVTWVPRLTDPDEKYFRLFETVRPVVSGACLYRSRAYGLKDAIEQSRGPVRLRFQGSPEPARARRGWLSGHHLLRWCSPFRTCRSPSTCSVAVHTARVRRHCSIAAASSTRPCRGTTSPGSGAACRS